MIKCPKCNFEQPPDTYCANCGVNMETYRPEPKPLLKSVLTHWIFHLSILIALILGLVFYDRGHEPQSASLASTRSAINEEDAAATSAEAATPVSAAVAEPQRNESLAENQKIPGNAMSSPPVHIGKKGIRVTFYQASKSALNEMIRDSQAGNFNGEAAGGLLSGKRWAQFSSSRELKALSSNNYKDFDSQHPIMLFKGQRGAGKNIGLYMQITPLKEDSGTLQMEVKSWGNFKLQGSEENLFVSEMTLNSNSHAFITGFLPKDKALSDEEKMILDADRTLKVYNREDFWDGSSDLLMVIELTDSAD